MREGVKQRVVGAIVLLALAVIFIPVLFDMEPPRSIDTTSRIPEAPQIEPVTIPEPVRVEGVEAPKSPEQSFLPEEPSAEVEEPSAQNIGSSAELVEPSPEIIEPAGEVIATTVAASEPEQQQSLEKTETSPQPVAEKKMGIGEDNLLKAWVVQVASYQAPEKAKTLVGRLQAAGFKAYTRSASTNGVQVNRVFVGPMVNRDSADSAKARIDKDFAVKSMVLPFKP